MIRITRLDGRDMIVNTDLIESIEETPDTIISFTTGRKIMVREKLDDVLSLILQYRSRFPMYAIPSGGEGSHQGAEVLERRHKDKDR